MKIVCACCNLPFVVYKTDIEFYGKLDAPLPTWCPECREMRRMSWCNEGILYSRKCDLCAKSVVSQYAPSNPRKAYCVNCWWSDKWEALDYGIELNLNKSILLQLKEIILKIPHCHTNTDIANENSEYTHHAGHEKNCYMLFHSSYAEDCYYGYGIKKARDCVDNYYCYESELCYECIDVQNCYDLAWSQDCSDCSSSRFLFDCIGCKSCFLCTGLRNKEYYFLNKKLSKFEYEKQLAKINLGSQIITKSLIKKYESIKDSHPRKNLKRHMAENSIGDHLYKAKDSQYCFDCSDIEYSKYCSQLQMGTRNCFDIYQFGIDIELCYESAMIGYNIYNCRYCYDLLQQCSNLQYCISCHSSKDCFACFGLKHKQYCILNRQYSKDQYFDLLKKVIERMKKDGEYGSFMPIKMSPHAYNETIAATWYPKNEEQVIELGSKWEKNLPFSNGKVNLTDIPDSIDLVDDMILSKVLACTKCSRDFKIIVQELKFYRKNSYPIPRECFQCRRANRSSLRNPRKICFRTCDKCQTEIPSTIKPQSNYKVYCEKCYLSEVK